MRRAHFIVGIVAVSAFLLSGQWMRHHTPPLASFDAGTRLMFRSRHIYILAGGLVNLMLGLYFEWHAGGWRRAVQAGGSAILIASPALLAVAFGIEATRGFQERMPWSQAGLYLLFGGAMAHLAASLGTVKRLPPRK
jgi:hypothetical protein